MTLTSTQKFSGSNIKTEAKAHPQMHHTQQPLPPYPISLNLILRFQHSVLFTLGFPPKLAHSVLTAIKSLRTRHFKCYS